MSRPKKSATPVVDETAVFVFGPRAQAEKLALAEQAKATAAGFVVATAAENDQAGELRRMIKTEIDALEDQRKALTKPLLDHKRRIDDLFKPSVTAFQAAYDLLGKAIAAYLLREDQRAREAAQAALAAHNAGDHATGRELMAVASDAAVAQAPVGTSVRFEWRGRIVDAAAVPRQFCDPNQSRIDAFAKAHAPEAPPPPTPGVEWYQRPITTTRKG